MDRAAWYASPENLRAYWRKGTVTYVCALLIIAALSTLSHYWVQSIVDAEEATARVVNIAGRQRMLSQRITRMAGDLVYQNWDSEATQESYTKSIELLLSMHYSLMGGSVDLKIPEPTLDNIKELFLSKPYELDRSINQFSGLAKSINNQKLSAPEKS